ncbi:MAG: putative HNHc nuclease [Leuconostoc pseudomesenteroides]|uniref:putative HNHc nuclease n=1 Tax=Leuconostoc pseudomesenteroides TaxID=33968 RepID=UPI001E4408BB|nr:putative HNHc nuclease [Leuconostoc pseudomesenteroides]MCC7668906.1 hypothetical protein [Leuconostoc pseudomesenteroides]
MPIEFTGRVVAYDGKKLTIDVRDLDINWNKLSRYNDGKAPVVSLIFDDQQRRSLLQNRYIHAIIGDIAAWQGEDPTEVKAWFKYAFGRAFEMDDVKTSLMSIEEANAFINLLIMFASKHDVPMMKYKPLEMLAPDDIRAFEYQCLINKQCVICGAKPSDLHHLDTVGSGRDRRKINHLGHRAEQLCRKHHQEAHSLGVETFLKKYHLHGIEIDKHIARIHRLRDEGTTNE